MRIPEFSVRNQRAIRLAACDAVPRVMAITGPNGCGKSTLLNALRGIGGGAGHTLYVGPHRTSRRQQVRMRFLGQQRIEMSSLLAAPSLPGFDGISLPSHERDAWNFDESQSYLKYSLCQIELDRQAAIAERYDSTGSVSRDEMPSVWEPLRGMTHNLLPHLEFYRIDITNRDQVKCLWRVHTKDVLVDIDDLSSGEKAIIQLFFPLVEHQINERLNTMRGVETSSAPSSVTVLMDEPELHLHPNLQAKVLDYIRALSLSEDVQFILATHSPAMVEQTINEELYLLRPSELVGADDNQLIRIATTEERLQMLRDVFGSTSNITAMRKILVVEGNHAGHESRRASDARIYGFLSERFGQLTIVAGGGKLECLSLVNRLQQLLHDLTPNLTAVALLDRDCDEPESTSADALHLPVSTIENLLVDPDVIWEALTTVRHKTSFKTSFDVAEALDDILEKMEAHEIIRRIKAGVPPRTFRLTDPVMEARRQVDEFTSALLGLVSEPRLSALESTSRSVVERLKAEASRREFFDGKRICDTFFKQHVHQTGMSKEIFVYECARQASKRQSVSGFVERLFNVLGIARETEPS